ncbi:uncharacterized protein EV422DRAFT_485841, partial [Fimicolochytrium jonesii]|uniref:uncharacterized protein n=1 Tax=Fimicolochytrium jonesii TaxID=1396493 RepID=UPI0022FEDB0D
QPEYVAICLSVKGQVRDLPEWFIHHYHHIGIRRFYIMDDGTKPPLSEQPENHYGIPRSAITFQYFDETDRMPYMQNHMYNECNRRFRDRHTWIAYIDADEFLEMTSTTKRETLDDVLREFEKDPKVGAVGVNWQVHNSNNLTERPPSARKGFTRCIVDDPEQDNRHIKSIVRTAYYSYPTSPHSFFTTDDTITVGENGDKVDYAFRRPITRQRMALHHYVVKSKAEYAAKVQRGNGMDQPKGWDFWDHVEKMPSVDCMSMAHYSP